MRDRESDRDRPANFRRRRLSLRIVWRFGLRRWLLPLRPACLFCVFHVLRMAIKVMSSCCGCEPMKSRTSSVRRFTIAGAPSVRAGLNGLHHPFRAEFIALRVERFGDAVGVKDQAIIAFQLDGKIARYPIEHVSTVNADGHSRRLDRSHGCGAVLIKSGASCPARASVTVLCA